MKAENHKRKGKSDNFFSTASKLRYCQCHLVNENYMTVIHIGRKMRVLFFIDINTDGSTILYLLQLTQMKSFI